MASSIGHSSNFTVSNNQQNASVHFALVVSQWHAQITDALAQSALETLLKAGVTRENIVQIEVPGAYELSIAAQWMAQKSNIHAVICLGCVIEGETRHFEYICSAVANGITQVSLKYNKPVVFGVLTTQTLKQALDRTGGRYGNKGEEAAETALKMITLGKELDISIQKNI